MDQRASFFGRLAADRGHAVAGTATLAKPASGASGRSLWLRLIASDEAGAAMEFALVAPVLFALILATLQLVLVFLVQAALETACEGSARYVTTGQAQSNFVTTTNAQGVTTTSQQQFMTYVCTQMPPFMGCGSLYADVTSGADYSTVNLAEPTWTYDINGNVNNTFSYSPGTQNQIVVVRLYYFWPVISLFGFNITTTTNTIKNNTMYDVVLATSVAKSESY